MFSFKWHSLQIGSFAFLPDLIKKTPEIDQVGKNVCPELRKLRKIRFSTLTGLFLIKTTRMNEMTPIENERCLNIFNQVISRDKSTCNMSKEEDTLGGCQCQDVLLMKWLLVNFPKYIPLKFHQPCWSSVLARLFSSITPFSPCSCPHLSDLLLLSLFSPGSAKRLSCWKGKK